MSIVANTICFLILVATLVLCLKVEPQKHGFWCHDETIRYPAKPMIVNYKYLLAIVTLVPTTIFILLDLNKLTNLRNYIYGFVLNMVLTMYCKYVVQRPRPNFWSICQPSVNCSISDRLYIDDYTCTRTDSWSAQANESFFSGHSSLGTYAAMYMILFSYERFSNFGKLTRMTISFVIFIAGLYPGFTQFRNHWHHWSDVAIGQAIGIMTALLVYYVDRQLDIQHNQEHRCSRCMAHCADKRKCD